MTQFRMKGIANYIQYQCDLNAAKGAIGLLANHVKNFKIGKTGKTKEERFSESDYNGVYDDIDVVYTSQDSDFVSRMEADLIEEFQDNPKCDNIRTTDKDEMSESDKYSVYVVWIVEYSFAAQSQ